MRNPNLGCVKPFVSNMENSLIGKCAFVPIQNYGECLKINSSKWLEEMTTACKDDLTRKEEFGLLEDMLDFFDDPMWECFFGCLKQAMLNTVKVRVNHYYFQY